VGELMPRCTTTPNRRWFPLIRHILRATIGFLALGTLLGAACGRLVADEYLIIHATDIEWRRPGQFETWQTRGMVIGALTGFFIGAIADVGIAQWKRQRAPD
jgi:hypothetical protein